MNVYTYVFLCMYISIYLISICAYLARLLSRQCSTVVKYQTLKQQMISWFSVTPLLSCDKISCQEEKANYTGHQNKITLLNKN